MSEWRHAPVRTNCKQYCANPHRTAGESVCEVLLVVSKMSTADQFSLIICGNKNIIVFSSQIHVLVCIDRFHRIDLAAWFGELTRTSSSVKITPALKFIHLFHSVRLVSLSESSLHIGRAGWEVKVSFTVLLLQHFLLIVFFAFLPFSLEEMHFV